MIAFAKRNMKIFFRDKSAVFFSLLGVFIIIGLYALFLGDVWSQNLTQIPNARTLMDSWIMAGLIAVTSVTTTMGAFEIMVEDKKKKIIKDFYSAPIKRSKLVGGYIISSCLIGIIMSFVAAILAQLYLLSGGGDWLSLSVIAKCTGLIFISTLANTSIILFIVSFFKSSSAFSTASTIIGTLIGFLTGIYIPLGSLPDSVQFVVKILPTSHSVALFRQIIMEKELQTAFNGAPAEYLQEFSESMGVVLKFGDYTVTPLVSVSILLGSAVLFFIFSILNISRKKR